MTSHGVCPSCGYCDNPTTADDHEAWWWAMCERWGQCATDPDAFWQFDFVRLREETAKAKADPIAYREEGHR